MPIGMRGGASFGSGHKLNKVRLPFWKIMSFLTEERKNLIPVRGTLFRPKETPQMIQ